MIKYSYNINGQRPSHSDLADRLKSTGREEWRQVTRSVDNNEVHLFLEGGLDDYDEVVLADINNSLDGVDGLEAKSDEWVEIKE